MTALILTWILINVIAFALQLFFKSKEQIIKDVSMLIFHKNHFFTFISILVILVVFPFTIPYSLYHIYLQIKNTYF